MAQDQLMIQTMVQSPRDQMKIDIKKDKRIAVKSIRASQQNNTISSSQRGPEESKSKQ